MKKHIPKIIGIGVVLGIVALFWFGILDFDQIRNKVRQIFYRGRGAASSAMQGPQGDPKSAAACRENLKRIESAKRAVASEKAITVGAVSRDDVAKKLGGAFPACPSGGTYNINDLGRMPTCSIGSGSSGPSDGHVILSF